MADVFISYAQEDQQTVSKIAQCMTAQGLDVWWDRKLQPGKDFDRELEDMIDKSRSVLVVWSKNSVDSRWVRAESSEGLDQKKLVPLQIEDCRIPLEFRRLHTARLLGWNGQPQNDQLVSVIASLKKFGTTGAGSTNGGDVANRTANDPWSIKDVKFGWTSVEFDLSRGGQSHRLAYQNKFTYEIVTLDGAEVCRGGSTVNFQPFFQISIQTPGDTSICILEPVYSELARLFTVRLSSLRVSVDGTLLADLQR